MGIEKLIALAALLGAFAVSTGRLPRILTAIRVADLRLLKDSQASKWGQGMLLTPTSNRRNSLFFR